MQDGDKEKYFWDYDAQADFWARVSKYNKTGLTKEKVSIKTGA